MAEIGTIGVFHRLGKIIAGHRLPVMAIKVKVNALAIAIRTQQRMHHADQLGTLFIDRGGIEIVDFHIAVRADRMGQWPSVLGELGGAKCVDVLDALHRAGTLIGREFLIAENGQTFFE